MISKTTFTDIVNIIKKANEDGTVVADKQAAFVTVLEQDTGCQKGADGKTWISWWIYDNDFGKNKLTMRFNNTDEQIETPEELYDLIVYTKGKR